MTSDGELSLPDRAPQHDRQWVDDFDIVGLGFDHPISIDHTGSMRPYPANAARSDGGFAPLPEELGVLLQRMADRVEPPLVIASNGLSTTNDGWRTEVLEATLDVVDGARSDGINLVGYFHDTAIDGYEWRAGFDTHRGLITRDRTIKDSGLLYRSHITR